jgi:hypothetical protein
MTHFLNVWKAVIPSGARAVASSGVTQLTQFGQHVGFSIGTAGTLSLTFQDGSVISVPVAAGLLPCTAKSVDMSASTAVDVVAWYMA